MTESKLFDSRAQQLLSDDVGYVLSSSGVCSRYQQTKFLPKPDNDDQHHREYETIHTIRSPSQSFGYELIGALVLDWKGVDADAKARITLGEHEQSRKTSSSYVSFKPKLLMQKQQSDETLFQLC